MKVVLKYEGKILNNWLVSRFVIHSLPLFIFFLISLKEHANILFSLFSDPINHPLKKLNPTKKNKCNENIIEVTISYYPCAHYVSPQLVEKRFECFDKVIEHFFVSFKTNFLFVDIFKEILLGQFISLFNKISIYIE